MAEHRQHIVTFIKRGEYDHGARCQCGWTTKERRTRQMVEDDVQAHQAYVERVRRAMGGGKAVTVSLMRRERDWYLERANDPLESDRNRELWQQLADEITARLGHTPTKEEQPELPLDLPE